MKHRTHAAPRAPLTALAHDFARWPVSGARFIDEAECLVSVLLAIAVAHALGMHNVGWAAFSAYMVIRASFAESLRRGSLRILGTALGVSLAALLAPWLLPTPTPALLSAALAVVGAVTLYLALLERTGYGWMFTGLSFAMVLLDSMTYGSDGLGTFAQLRVLEVCAGTGASIVVSALSAVAVRPHVQLTAPALPPAAARFCHRAALRHALKGAAALALIPWVWTVFHFKALSQTSITIMTVMMVPMADLVASPSLASTRSRQRFIGAGVGGLLASGILVLSHGSALAMTVAASVGVVAGRHIENSKLSIAYAGTQFALAFLVVLVPDGYSGLKATPGMERVLGILLGMALLEAMRLLFSPARPPGNRPG